MIPTRAAIGEPGDAAPDPDSHPVPDDAPDVARQPLGTPAAALVVVAALGWAYAGQFRWLWDVWVNDPNYSHGFLIIPVALLMLVVRLREPGPSMSRPLYWGWLLLVLVLVARGVFHERGNQWAETVTLLPALGCLALTLGGWKLLWRALPAVGYLIFMIPLQTKVNALLAQPLQSLATSASVLVMKLTGLWAIAEGNVIYVGNRPLEVAEACNGLSMMMSLAADVVATVILVALSNWMRVLLLLSAAPVALASNVIRIVATGWAVHLLGAESGGRFAHDLAGWLMMPLALLLVGLELGLLLWLFEEEVTMPEPMLLGNPINLTKEGDDSRGRSLGRSSRSRRRSRTRSIDRERDKDKDIDKDKGPTRPDGGPAA